MYIEDYFLFLFLVLVCMIISLYASNKVKKTFNKYNQKECSSGLTGREAVNTLMREYGVNDISIGRTKGHLTDHYHPSKKIINLSESTYNSRSIASVAVAAHEMGHVMQNKDGYLFYKLRTILVPVVNFGSRLSMPFVLLGVLIDLLSIGSNPDLGFYIALVGVILYGGSFVFSLITLPVEINASRRAGKMLLQSGVLVKEEMNEAKEVLSAAALTYFASMVTSLVYFLRFFVRVLTIFGRRKND